MGCPCTKKKLNEGPCEPPATEKWKHSIQSWPEQMIPGGASRLMMVVSVAGTLSCLYALILLLTTRPCWLWMNCEHVGCNSDSLRRHADAMMVAGSDTCTIFSAAYKQGEKESSIRVRPTTIHAVNLSTAPAYVATAPISTNLSHIVFGIAASASLWDNRKEYAKVWWQPRHMRGFVWLDRSTGRRGWESSLPPWRISENTDGFKYTHPLRFRFAIRISRIVSEMVRLGLEDVRWFVMGDDDTIFIPENLVKVLSKYDHTQYYYIGSNSESHIQNIALSYNMAFGGGGFAISYPLAKALEKSQDGCLQRYPQLFGSDDRMQACMAEMGVPLTKELGFHQYDVQGNVFGLMASHPIAPVVSIHHLDMLDPFFPNLSRLEGLKHLSNSMRIDPSGFLQQSICYDRKKQWSISISWGFTVQVFRGILYPRELEMPSRTFVDWKKKADLMAYAFNTRAVPRHPCRKPILFYMETVHYGDSITQTVSNYTREQAQPAICKWRIPSPATINWIRVVKNIDHDMWSKVVTVPCSIGVSFLSPFCSCHLTGGLRVQAPRRKCCRVLSSSNGNMEINVGDCADGELEAI